MEPCVLFYDQDISLVSNFSFAMIYRKYIDTYEISLSLD
jgi:hypothetical protein